MDPLDLLLQDIKAEVEGKKPPEKQALLSSVTSSPVQKREDASLIVGFDELLSPSTPIARPTVPPLSSVTVSLSSSAPFSSGTSGSSLGDDPLLSSLRLELSAEEAAAQRERARLQAEAERFRREEEERCRREEAREQRRREEEERRLAQQQREALAAEERRFAEEKRKQQAAQLEEAKRFLASLKPKSKDAQWFEKFAENYPSRLDAALAYVQGLDDIGV